jgi:hypothetical protein
MLRRPHQNPFNAARPAFAPQLLHLTTSGETSLRVIRRELPRAAAPSCAMPPISWTNLSEELWSVLTLLRDIC